MKFIEHVHDVTENQHNKIKINQVSTYSFMNTVEKNELHFTRRNVEKAKQAKELYACIGRPPMNTCIHYLDNNIIRDMQYMVLT